MSARTGLSMRWQFNRLKKSGLSRKIYQRDSNTCRHCGFNYALHRDRFSKLISDSPIDVCFPYLTIDHIRPIARGGTNAPNNLRTLCSTCNGSKNCRSSGEWKYGKKMREHMRLMSIIREEQFSADGR